ncbi:UDP-N-acetylmuramoyl-L-alanyl-D-glutamate--2,6-diaminopimelate ligase [Bacteriovoracaceae bacterium]|nr:UDP-N-acetylmuramoyl-L-alanyl-D-glutamate--2,6-diaminopimelate ligase [Bacteriovoracaceae bacterium]
MSSLEKIFQKYNIEVPEGTSFSSIEVSTNLQNAKDNEIIFYKLLSEKSFTLFKERLIASNPLLIILNKKPIEEIQNNYVVVEESKWRALQAELLDKIYPIKNEIKIIGITGTNGKTSTAFVISEILKQNKKTVCTVGTNGVFINGRPINFDIPNTSPGYVELRKIIHHAQEKSDFIVIEVSSHSLSQDRLRDLKLAVAGWTNISQDHLDYHKNMESYKAAKEKIFDYLVEGSSCFFPAEQKELYKSIERPNIEICKKVSLGSNYPSFFKLSHNYQNLSLAVNICNFILGKKVNFDLYKIQLPKGRFECLESNDRLFVIDYAHTPDALENILSSIKDSFPGKSVWTVFGCGGDRDKSKRPIMAKVACEHSDFVVVTSDNPRTENSKDIISDIEKGMSGSYTKIENRSEAIKFAVDESKEKTIVLIAGKGHETYQEIGTKKYEFDDMKVVKGFLNVTS